MSLKLELLTAIALLSFEPPTDAHDIYSHLKDRWGTVVAMRRIVDPCPTG